MIPSLNAPPAPHLPSSALAPASLRFVQDYDLANPKTHQGMDVTKVSMGEIYKYFGLDAMTVDFVGHAIALHRDDSYMNKPALDTVNRIKLYNESLYRYEGLTAPYIYPRYGLGELPQVRCCSGLGNWLERCVECSSTLTWHVCSRRFRRPVASGQQQQHDLVGCGMPCHAACQDTISRA